MERLLVLWQGDMDMQAYECRRCDGKSSADGISGQGVTKIGQVLVSKILYSPMPKNLQKVGNNALTTLSV